MTLSYDQLGKLTDLATETITETFSFDSWRQTALLYLLAGKSASYLNALTEKHGDVAELATAGAMAAATFASIDGNYDLPADDERWNSVKEWFQTAVNGFIKDISDDACQDLLFIGALMRYVADMRVEAWSKVIEDVGPSEGRFKALKITKRESEIVGIYLEKLVEV